MMFKAFRARYLSVLLAVVAAGCSRSGPSTPSTAPSNSSSQLAPSAMTPEAGAAVVGTMATGSVTTPRLLSPAANTLILYQSQPVTLVVANAMVTKPGGTTYTFEVATDLAFTSKVQTKDGVVEGSGQSSVRLDVLGPSSDYYWHVRATSGGTTGVFSAPLKFTIGAQITISTPVPIAPLNGAQTAPRPALRVANVVRTGPAGAITYKFEISTVASFASILMTGTNTEGINETGFIPTADLPSSGALFWRATAMDVANGVSSAPSPVQSFTASRPSQAQIIATQLGVPLWPGVQPPGTHGHATMGDDPALGVGWAVQTLFYAPGNVHFQSPDIEMLRYFDLFDRDFQPEAATAWMNANGYPTQGLWYPPPEKAVLGLKYVYIAARGKVSVNGIWDLVLRVE